MLVSLTLKKLPGSVETTSLPDKIAIMNPSYENMNHLSLTTGSEEKEMNTGPATNLGGGLKHKIKKYTQRRRITTKKRGDKRRKTKITKKKMKSKSSKNKQNKSKR